MMHVTVPRTILTINTKVKRNIAKHKVKLFNRIVTYQLTNNKNQMHHLEIIN